MHSNFGKVIKNLLIEITLICESSSSKPYPRFTIDQHWPAEGLLSGGGGIPKKFTNRLEEDTMIGMLTLSPKRPTNCGKGNKLEMAPQKSGHYLSLSLLVSWFSDMNN